MMQCNQNCENEICLLQFFFMSAQPCNSYSGYSAYDRGHNLKLKSCNNSKDNILPSL